MKIKFSIGDKVHYMKDNLPHIGRVSEIVVRGVPKGVKILYKIDDCITRLEENISDTKLGLRLIIFGN